MADHSSIEWTDATWNPVTGCTKVSPGCDNCYAETFAERWRGTPGHHFERGFDLTLRPERLDQPLRWRRSRRIFVNSMSDLFHTDVPDEFIARVFAVAAARPQHTFQILTKQHGRMRSLLSAAGFEDLVLDAWDELREEYPDKAADRPGQHWYPLSNVWLGVSVEDQKRADLRIPALLKTPAAVRWISAEPLLGAVRLDRIPYRGDVDYVLDVLRREYGQAEPRMPFGMGLSGLGGIDWVVAGGESGHGARPMHPAWARSLRDQCHAARVPFLFKQWGQWSPVNEPWRSATYDDRPALWLDENGTSKPWGAFDGTEPTTTVAMYRVGKKASGRELDGRVWDEYPQAVTL